MNFVRWNQEKTPASPAKTETGDDDKIITKIAGQLKEDVKTFKKTLNVAQVGFVFTIYPIVVGR